MSNDFFKEEKESDFLADLTEQFYKTPLKFNMGGSSFRWQVFQIAYEISHSKDKDSVFNTAEEIIKWINQ